MNKKEGKDFEIFVNNNQKSVEQTIKNMNKALDNMKNAQNKLNKLFL